MTSRKKNSDTVLNKLENDPAHHLAGPFLPQTPLGSNTPVRNGSPVTEKMPARPPVHPWLRWAVQPSSAFKLLILPIILYLNWELFAPLACQTLSLPFSSYRIGFLLHTQVTHAMPRAIVIFCLLRTMWFSSPLCDRSLPSTFQLA